MQKLFSVHCRNSKYPPFKLTRPLKRDHFKGKVGFHPSHFSGGYVKFWGSNEHFVCVHTCKYEEHVLRSKVSNCYIKCPPTPCKGKVSRMDVFNTFYTHFPKKTVTIRLISPKTKPSKHDETSTEGTS